MFKKSQVSSNFSANFSFDSVSGSGAALRGSVGIEADSTFNSSAPGAPQRFFVFYNKKYIQDIQLLSTMGNIAYLGTKEIVRSEFITISSTSPVNTQYGISSLHSIEVVGRSYNYAGLDFVNEELIPLKSDKDIVHILASVVINYTASGDYYEITHTPPGQHANDYSIDVMAIGTKT